MLIKLFNVSIAVSGEVDTPETAMTLMLEIDLALTASDGVRHVAAYTPGNLLAKIATPTPVPQATRPRVSVELSVVELMIWPILEPMV